jgi:FAD dependent oxidoreductase
MFMKKILLLQFLICLNAFAQKPIQYDICVYGGTSAGIIAAYTAKMYGKTVILVESSGYLGGLTAGGLGQTDIGNKYAITGISRQFYRKIGKHYGRFEQWTFEPKVAQNILLEYNKNTDKTLLYNELQKVSKVKGAIKSIQTFDTKSKKINVIRAKQFIDCSYEGDLMAKAGVSYTLGRESNLKYKETWNGVHLLDKHQFPDGIDPFRIKGKPKSGLLWGISPNLLAKEGSGDKKIQAYNFRMCLTDSAENRIAITMPTDYNPKRYELLLRYIEKKQPKELNWALMHIQPMPHHKLDINNSGPFSTNLIGGNYAYPNASFAQRRAIQKKHENHIKGFFYFLGNDPRVPEHLRKEMLTWGYPKDEYLTNNNFSPQMYVREARRMVSDMVMTENHCVGKETVTDGIGMAAYTMDSHNTQRIVVKDSTGKYQVKNEGDVQKGLGGLDPYPISYRSIVPKKSQCSNLSVPVCLSASHIAFGSIRMEPVFMVLAQSAATAASMAIDNKSAIQNISVEQLQKELNTNPLADKSPSEILIDNFSENFKAEGAFEIIKKAYGRYGKDYVLLKDGSATFSNAQMPAGGYSLYIYIPKAESLSKIITAEVVIGKETFFQQIELHSEENDWYKISDYNFQAGQKTEVILRTNSREGNIIADAVLWTPRN